MYVCMYVCMYDDDDDDDDDDKSQQWYIDVHWGPNMIHGTNVNPYSYPLLRCGE